MDINTLIMGMSSQMTSRAFAAEMSTAVTSKAISAQEQAGQAVLSLLESSQTDPSYVAKATGKGSRLNVVA
jgi:cobalamin biosynthesis protein CbiG